MYLSLNWLRDFVDWAGSASELDDLFTRAGVKVEGIKQKGTEFPNIVIAQILESSPHPNADRLSVCRVDDGSGQPRPIVCGAKNYRVGDKVPLALPGAVLPAGLKIKVGKLRGVESQGMLCSSKELGLADDAEGLLILPTEAPVGRPLSQVYPNDTIFELEITPNRPDWLSHLGLAREVAAFSGRDATRAEYRGSRDLECARWNRLRSGNGPLPVLFGAADSGREGRTKSAVAFRPAYGGRLATHQQHR